MTAEYVPGVVEFTEQIGAFPLVAQGWRCPVCGKVMAPWQAWCLFCTGRTERAPTDGKHRWYGPSTSDPLSNTGTHTSDPLPPNPIVVSAGG